MAIRRVQCLVLVWIFFSPFFFARWFGDYALLIPLVALPYLLKRNTILLGCLLFWFRFTLCTTIILGFHSRWPFAVSRLTRLVPQSSGSAVPLIPIAFIAALLLLREIRSTPAVRRGPCLYSISLPGCAREYTTAWAAENFYRTELLVGVGQAFAFIGLVGCTLFSRRSSPEALAKAEWVPSFSAFFHVVRIFRRHSGRHLHGPLPGREGEIAFEPSGTPRQRW